MTPSSLTHFVCRKYTYHVILEYKLQGKVCMNTKNIMGAALSVCLLAGSASVSFAQTPSPSPTSRAQVRKEAQQEAREERRDQTLERIANRVEARFANHKLRLQNWIDRASARITKMEAKGKNVTEAKKALETAKTSLATAVTLGNDAVAKLRAVTPESWTQQKADAKAAREAVAKAQVAFAQVVKDFHQTILELKKANI